MNSTILRSLVGRKVSIFSIMGQSSARDDGIVVNYDDFCLSIQKGEEVFIFILANIRLIKVIE